MHRYLTSAGQLSFVSEETFAAALAVRGPFRFPAMRPSIPAPEEWMDYLQKSYAARWFANFGPVVRDFEERLTARFAAPGEVILTTNNCTSAITAALIALQATGDIVVPAFTFAATASGVMGAGARPLIVDVDAEEGVLDPALLEEVLSTRKVGGVVIVIPFGIACDVTRQLDICAKYGAPVVVDNASGLGGPVRTLRENSVEVYSMHATKPFAVGEGGAIRTHPRLVPALRLALNFGLEHGTPHGGWGTNGKMPEVLGAVGMAVLDGYSDVLRTRQSVAENYIEMLAPFELLKCWEVATDAPWQGFPVQFPSSQCVETFVGYLGSRSVDIRRYYRPSLEDWPGTIKLASSPNARRHSDTTITLPVYSDMGADEFAVLVAILGDAFEQFVASPLGSGAAAAHVA